MMIKTYHRLGRRDVCLMALAVAQVIIGWSNLAAPPATLQALTIFRDIPQVWLGLWWFIPAAAGIAAVISDRLDGAAFYLSYAGMFTWAFTYAASVWPLGELPAGVGLRTAGIFWAISIFILAIAGWRENLPDAKIPPLPDELGE